MADGGRMLDREIAIILGFYFWLAQEKGYRVVLAAGMGEVEVE